MMLQYTALGDSLTVGVGAGLFEPGFVQRYKRKMEVDLNEEVSLLVFAKSGLETSEILAMLNEPFIMEQVKKADVITITGCGNDLLQSLEIYEKEKDEQVFLEASSHCQKNYSGMLEKIRDIKGEKDTRYLVRLLNLYNPFPSIELADKWISGFNRHLKQLESAPQIKVIDTYAVFKGREKEYLSIDRVHPNSRGYEAMAEKLRAAGYGPLKS
ncbi:GDSL-type esterase/lipase family protein [Bacillus haynesii]|uniref:GDSL-type esterase/lipase family protein n=1 Tax=Bacillus haynesii TaxID=1925021 RepID=UPI0015F538B6|nr:GDSL-type esterase/lipase family protein [Bacillus haynesii]MCY7846005.1 GDSL-type esterase/lipase family protein [Bacillus haynesii]MCY8018740.1 GDSL-type esterase/lipase family protein [Bacillus haynesii]MCY8217390.1 GDSL-type esterase/lipase family protein [Bacillus haynesii]MCY8583054.1 GDSL-type esterase/lipase family protein [Bacillus haynesii]MCY8610372.1 GDSL-type esterase/lipase family protein [Bacillus haynesii]